MFYNQNNSVKINKTRKKMTNTVPITIPLPILQSSERLGYEQVGWHNYRKLLSMFENDKSIFVMNDYKSKIGRAHV